VERVRIARATLRKLIRRPATWVTFLLLNVFTLLIFVAVGASARQASDPQAALAARSLFHFPQTYRIVLAFVFMNGLLAATYGAAIAGSEWQWGTLKAAAARGESRGLYVVGTFLGIVIFLALGAVGGLLIGVPAAILGAVVGGLPLDGAGDTSWMRDLPDPFCRGVIAFAMEGALGFAIATIAKSQIAGIGVVIGLNVAEGIAGIFAHDVFRWFPFTSANALVSGGGSGVTFGGQIQRGLDSGTALIVVVAWLVAALALAALWTERAEIGG
jgi:ABC-type transport system involved in multi-copper enzyme maturation permease subunit